MLENQRILLANLEQQKKTALKVLNEAQTELDTMAEAKLLYEATILETEQANEDRKRKKISSGFIETKRQARQSVKADVTGSDGIGPDGKGAAQEAISLPRRSRA